LLEGNGVSDCVATKDYLSAFPIPAKLLIPHRPPMLLIDRLLASNGQSGEVESVVRENCSFLTDNKELVPEALLEMTAQAYAAVRGWEVLRRGLPLPAGFLVGIGGFEFFSRAVLGDTLLIRVETLGELESFVVVGTEAFRGGELLASGKIKVWSPPDWPPDQSRADKEMLT
jgi:3-hydroxyacyl-[acyl-carrier-protein] dehydratase